MKYAAPAAGTPEWGQCEVPEPRLGRGERTVAISRATRFVAPGDRHEIASPRLQRGSQ